MKKQERDAIIGTMKHLSSEKLEAMHSAFLKWDENHDRVKASYFWTPGGNSSYRRWEERQKTWSDKVEIGDVKIGYWSDCSCSRAHYYWSDGLTLRGMDAKISFGDIRKLDDAIREILEARQEKKEKTAEITEVPTLATTA